MQICTVHKWEFKSSDNQQIYIAVLISNADSSWEIFLWFVDLSNPLVLHKIYPNRSGCIH